MSVAALCRLLRCHWDNFARAFWPETPHERTRTELNRLNEELRRRQFRLLRCRQKIEELRDYLEPRGRYLGSLGLGLSSTSAESGALERGQRTTLERLQRRLRKRERAYERLCLYFRHRSQQRTDLRDRLLSPALWNAARSDEDESDPGYPF